MGTRGTGRAGFQPANQHRMQSCATNAWAAGLGLMALLALPAHGDQAGAQARQVVDKFKDAVVTVRLVIKTTMGGAGAESQPEEQKYDVCGTVIDPSGLTVMSLLQLDPSEMYRRMGGGSRPGEAPPNVESQVSDAKLRLADGTEVAAKVVLRDKDLDLAFLRPTEKLPKPAAAVDLAQSASVLLLDEVVTVNRLSNSADWAIAPRLDRIQAILTKPRTVYVPQGGDQLGTPAFSLDGKVIGITVVRLTASPEGENADEPPALGIIVPAADVLDVAKQAAE